MSPSPQGLDVHAATHLALLVGLVRGGKKWEAEVRGEYEAASGKDEINFDDRSLFRVAIQ